MQLHLIKLTFQVLDVSIPVELFIYDDTQKHSFNAFLDGEVAQLTSNSTALIREGRAWNFYFDSFIPEKFCVISIGKNHQILRLAGEFNYILWISSQRIIFKIAKPLPGISFQDFSEQPLLFYSHPQFSVHVLCFLQKLLCH